VEARLRAQMPLAEKRAHATWEVDNSGSLSETEAQVRRIWEEIRRGSG
jgi:dephospho-CoA kinase